jgi:hypothetical protein
MGISLKSTGVIVATRLAWSKQILQGRSARPSNRRIALAMAQSKRRNPRKEEQWRHARPPALSRGGGEVVLRKAG